MPIYIQWRKTLLTVSLPVTKNMIILDWPKSSSEFSVNTLWKNPNELFGQPNMHHSVYRLTLRNENANFYKITTITIIIIEKASL